ncbi:MAG: TolC family protein, partial [Planctomycetes bacterium]|nr:TolC family protein [Planctomycetota bacterium]
MRIKLLVTIIVSFVISGCGEKIADKLLPQPPLLGADISTFKAPAINKTGGLPVEATAQTRHFADPAGVINLQQALALALLENPDLKSFSWQVRADQAAQLQASLNPNPELSLLVEEFAGAGPMRRFEGAQTTLSVSQLIETGGKRQKRLRVATLVKEIAGWDYQAMRLAVFTDVTRAYTDVLSAQQTVELNSELLRLSEELVHTVSGRVKAGKDPPLDEAKAQIVLSNIKILHRQALNDLDFARSRLASLWAGQPKFKKAAGTLSMPDSIPFFDKITGYLDDNPEVARWAV